MKPGLSAIIFAILLGVSVHTAADVINRKPICGFGGVRFDTDFQGGRISECSQTGKREFTLGVDPENRPINPSPWYAFKVMAETRRTITVYLHYGAHFHRYVPKVSTDGSSWQPLGEAYYQERLAGKLLKLKLRVGPEPLYISAQEVFDNDDYAEWIASMAANPAVNESLLGHSGEGRPIKKLETNSTGREAAIMIIGRQHPPEVTGAIALTEFVETAFGDSQLAEQFRHRFNIIVVPNLNPDGVAHGHWRHNMGGVDLNRDWGPFTQPETQLMRRELKRFQRSNAADKPGKAKNKQRLYLFLDFHSTADDIFYTQLDTANAFTSTFTQEWLQAIDRRFPDYAPNSEAGHNLEKPTSKAYVYENFGVPAITYELGDEIDRQRLPVIVRGAAEEMMKLLLEMTDRESAKE